MRDILYHTISANHFLDCLVTDSLQGRNTHRLHANGTIPWDRESFSYRESVWYHGLCLSRNRHWAKAWKGSYSSKIILSLDRQRLKHRHRLVPYNWSETRVKFEFEEFLILANSGLTGADTLDRVESTHESRLRLINGFVGELTCLHSHVVALELLIGDKPLKSPGDHLQASQTQEKVQAYCAQYRIPFSTVTPADSGLASHLFL